MTLFKSIFLLFFCGIIITAGHSLGAPPVVHAIVIGVSPPARAGQDSLRYPQHDALLFSQYLRSHHAGAIADRHIHLLLGRRASRREIVRVTDSVFRIAQSGDVVIFFFSGHGVTAGATQEGFLMPYDGDPQHIEGTAIPMSQLADIMRAARAKIKQIYIDACHAGKFPEESGRKGSSLHVDEQIATAVRLKLAGAGEGTIGFLSASGREEAKEYPQLQHGVFTYYLVKGLQGEADAGTKDGIVTVVELEQYLYRQVMSYTKENQHPASFGSYEGDPVLSIVKMTADLQGLLYRNPTFKPFIREKPSAKRKPLPVATPKKLECRVANEVFGFCDIRNNSPWKLQLYFVHTVRNGLGGGYWGKNVNTSIPPGEKLDKLLIKVDEVGSDGKYKDFEPYILYFKMEKDGKVLYADVNQIIDACKVNELILDESNLKFYQK